MLSSTNSSFKIQSLFKPEGKIVGRHDSKHTFGDLPTSFPESIRQLQLRFTQYIDEIYCDKHDLFGDLYIYLKKAGEIINKHKQSLDKEGGEKFITSIKLINDLTRIIEQSKHDTFTDVFNCFSDVFTTLEKRLADLNELKTTQNSIYTNITDPDVTKFLTELNEGPKVRLQELIGTAIMDEEMNDFIQSGGNVDSFIKQVFEGGSKNLVDMLVNEELDKAEKFIKANSSGKETNSSGKKRNLS